MVKPRMVITLHHGGLGELLFLFVFAFMRRSTVAIVFS